MSEDIPKPLYDKKSPVDELTPSDFTGQRITKFLGKSGMVVFYADWCPHCRDMVSEWTSLARQVKKVFPIAAIDCALDQNTNICNTMGIQGYPTIKIFDASGNMVDYNGDRSLDGYSQVVCQIAHMLCKSKL